MDRMKTLIKYALWLIIFFVFSEIVIYIGLNASYSNIRRNDQVKQVQMLQAQSTLVNGRMSGKIIWDKENDITGKYVKIDFYSERKVKVGTKYIEISANQVNPEQNFNIYFELHNIYSYEISIADEKNTGEISIFPKEMSRQDIILATFLTLLVF